MSVDCKLQVGIGQANGTFGELVQGILPCGKSFMLTLPIKLFSRATFVPNDTSNTLTVFPENKQKSCKMLKNTLAYLGFDLGGHLTIESEILEGKGLASSSADLVATIDAVANTMNTVIDKTTISDLMKKIEPSDAVMYKKPVMYDYFQHKLICSEIPAIKLKVLAIDEGGTVDTVRYNNQQRLNNYQNCINEYVPLFEETLEAAKAGDLEKLGRLSTRSAKINQAHNPKKHFEAIVSIANKYSALGVSVAHSGTFIGILLNPASPDFEWQYTNIKTLMSQLTSCNVLSFDSV